MTSELSIPSSTLTCTTRAAFMNYLHENPNSRRISQAEKANIIKWLTDPNSKSSSQKESSRRNYVRKSFIWEENSQKIFCAATSDQGRRREVITEDMIANIVVAVHERSGHAGWDATWKDISCSYYGILRADVIFLLKRCPVCIDDPRKRPKSLSGTVALDHGQPLRDYVSLDNLLISNSTSLDPGDEFIGRMSDAPK